MHELSIAVALVELASEAAKTLNANRVDAVHLRLGPLAGVAEEALVFSFALAATDTAAAGARLVIERTPLIAFCPVCGDDKPISSAQHLRCPTCSAFTSDVRGGDELQLTALELPDEPDC